jgi:kynureninase
VDVYHGAGVIPTDVQALDTDFAVGGSYKYLRGGPGACWLYVRPDHLDTLRTLDTGWFAKKDVFSYRRPEPPEFAPGGEGWNESTPPVFAAYQALAGLEFTLAIGVDRLRAYSLQQQARLKDLLRGQGLEAMGATEDRGAFLTVRHARAGELAAALDARGVHVDARGEYLRLCPDILNPDTELVAAAERLGNVMKALPG